MRALTVVPRRAHSVALAEMPEPALTDGPVLVQTLVIGICGTDREIVSGAFGRAPPGEDRLILGHFGAVAPDIVLECTGASSVILDAAQHLAAVGVLCLTGVSSGRRSISARSTARSCSRTTSFLALSTPTGATTPAAAKALASAGATWLRRLISRCVRLERADAFVPQRDDVKVVIDFAA
jgi:threonine dehydrogenase-like Zn-dependent dehydrogenase